mmetsp:Transcript_9013/g.19031  ORF Transcript_9013/g.19031 Transcript_9013/m.19031 type:complete len:246 (-) Transcript_9013:317-1054(-)
MTSGSQVPNWANSLESRARSLGDFCSSGMALSSFSMSRGNCAMVPLESKLTGRTKVSAVMCFLDSSDAESNMTLEWQMAETQTISSLCDLGLTTVLNLTLTVLTGGGGGTATFAPATDTKSNLLRDFGPSTMHSHLHQLTLPPLMGVGSYKRTHPGPMRRRLIKKFSKLEAPAPKIFSKVLPPFTHTFLSGTGYLPSYTTFKYWHSPRGMEGSSNAYDRVTGFAFHSAPLTLGMQDGRRTEPISA